MKARNGGVYGVAAASGVHYTRIYSFLRGGRMEEENAGKLRAACPEVPPSLWVDAFAPLPEGEDSPSPAAEASP